MSSVWLTASAVRYMICRLLRARASQGDGSFVGRRREDFAAFGLVHRVNDARAVVFVVAGDDVDFVGEVFDAVFRDARVEQQRAAELHLVAAGELVFADLACR